MFVALGTAALAFGTFASSPGSDRLFRRVHADFVLVRERLVSPEDRVLFWALLPPDPGPYGLHRVAGIVPFPNLDQRIPWPEHPDGAYRFRTNSLGLRSEREVPAEKRRHRLLLLGDSHVQGSCGPDEHVGARLEALLDEAAGRDRFEVWNAACAYTGPSMQLGMLDHRLEQVDPDGVIVVTFVGNDGTDELLLDALRRGQDRAVDAAGYHDVLAALVRRHAGAVYQGGNQVQRFRQRPEDLPRAAHLVHAAHVALAARCAELGLHLSIVLLPTKSDVEDDDAETLADLARIGGWTDEDLSVNRRLLQDVLRAGKDAGLPISDATPALRAADGDQYWRRDHHLSTTGHDTLARHLLGELEELVR